MLEPGSLSPNNRVSMSNSLSPATTKPRHPSSPTLTTTSPPVTPPVGVPKPQTSLERLTTLIDNLGLNFSTYNPSDLLSATKVGAAVGSVGADHATQNFDLETPHQFGLAVIDKAIETMPGLKHEIDVFKFSNIVIPTDYGLDEETLTCLQNIEIALGNHSASAMPNKFALKLWKFILVANKFDTSSLKTLVEIQQFDKMMGNVQELLEIFDESFNTNYGTYTNLANGFAGFLNVNGSREIGCNLDITEGVKVKEDKCLSPEEKGANHLTMMSRWLKDVRTFQVAKSFSTLDKGLESFPSQTELARLVHGSSGAPDLLQITDSKSVYHKIFTVFSKEKESGLKFDFEILGSPQTFSLSATPLKDRSELNSFVSVLDLLSSKSNLNKFLTEIYCKNSEFLISALHDMEQISLNALLTALDTLTKDQLQKFLSFLGCAQGQYSIGSDYDLSFDKSDLTALFNALSKDVANIEGFVNDFEFTNEPTSNTLFMTRFQSLKDGKIYNDGLDHTAKPMNTKPIGFLVEQPDKYTTELEFGGPVKVKTLHKSKKRRSVRFSLGIEQKDRLQATLGFNVDADSSKIPESLHQLIETAGTKQAFLDAVAQKANDDAGFNINSFDFLTDEQQKAQLKLASLGFEVDAEKEIPESLHALFGTAGTKQAFLDAVAQKANDDAGFNINSFDFLTDEQQKAQLQLASLGFEIKDEVVSDEIKCSLLKLSFDGSKSKLLLQQEFFVNLKLVSGDEISASILGTELFQDDDAKIASIMALMGYEITDMKFITQQGTQIDHQTRKDITDFVSCYETVVNQSVDETLSYFRQGLNSKLGVVADAEAVNKVFSYVSSTSNAAFLFSGNTLERAKSIVSGPLKTGVEEVNRAVIEGVLESKKFTFETLKGLSNDEIVSLHGQLTNEEHIIPFTNYSEFHVADIKRLLENFGSTQIDKINSLDYEMADLGPEIQLQLFKISLDNPKVIDRLIALKDLNGFEITGELISELAALPKVTNVIDRLKLLKDQGIDGFTLSPELIKKLAKLDGDITIDYLKKWELDQEPLHVELLKYIYEQQDAEHIIDLIVKFESQNQAAFESKFKLFELKHVDGVPQLITEQFKRHVIVSLKTQKLRFEKQQIKNIIEFINLFFPNNGTDQILAFVPDALSEEAKSRIFNEKFEELKKHDFKTNSTLFSELESKLTAALRKQKYAIEKKNKNDYYIQQALNYGIVDNGLTVTEQEYLLKHINKRNNSLSLTLADLTSFGSSGNSDGHSLNRDEIERLKAVVGYEHELPDEQGDLRQKAHADSLIAHILGSDFKTMFPDQNRFWLEGAVTAKFEKENIDVQQLKQLKLMLAIDLVRRAGDNQTMLDKAKQLMLEVSDIYRNTDALFEQFMKMANDYDVQTHFEKNLDVSTSTLSRRSSRRGASTSIGSRVNTVFKNIYKLLHYDDTTDKDHFNLAQVPTYDPDTSGWGSSTAFAGY